jgi:hypothetical protein
MSIQRIDSDSTHGWQARWPVEGRHGNGLTMLCSDSVHGGADKAHRAAKAAERLLQLRARELRRPQLLAELQRLVPARVRRGK